MQKPIWWTKEKIITTVVAATLILTGWLALERRTQTLVGQRLTVALEPVSNELSAVTTTMTDFEDELLTVRQQLQDAATLAAAAPAVVTRSAAAIPASQREAGAAAATGQTSLINLNTASREQLMSLPGIGAAYAERIISGRPFNSVDELTRVKGIGEKTLAKLRPLVTAP